MKCFKKYYRKVRIWNLQANLVIIALWILFMPNFTPLKTTADNIFEVSLNGTVVGTLGNKADAQKCLRDARRVIASQSEELVMAKADLTVAGSKALWGKVDDKSDVTEKMIEILSGSVITTLERSYTLKINTYSINLSCIEDVLELLKSSLSKYDTESQYDVNLVLDPSREVNVLTTQVATTGEIEKEEEAKNGLPQSGYNEFLATIVGDVAPTTEEKSFEDYELGLQSIDFGDKIEIVEAYMPQEEISDLDTAIAEVTKDKETNQIYEVQSGDTLGTIAEKFGLSLQELIDMNDAIESETSLIRVEDEIVVTVPEPELSVVYSAQEYYEEDYEAEVQYVDNDSWYTTESKVIQEPSAGHRRVVALKSYENDKELSTEIEKEEVTYAAVPKIIERGTIVPPTYIKPISGGRLSSGFGRRTSPTKGASSFHKGVDWATPVGTAVMASSSGVVTRAGWGSGYGYVVYVSHSDGRQTRYGHLSKILVKVGQSVSQGEKIALSGNTGVSTGPHLHFEILIGGTQVNPLDYLN
ncbi:MAG: M23 family metallopeptidase [Butyrivibrio sp.]|nr:M23 family metallopeptidase [Butyrivibrio sp.]